METWIRWSFLETFLSGMETLLAAGSQIVVGRLETFLSGMETPYPRFFALDVLPPLKPSLVEWKPVLEKVKPVLLSALKPSLVEWKLVPVHVPLPPSLHLETFLSGMETRFHTCSLTSLSSP